MTALTVIAARPVVSIDWLQAELENVTVIDTRASIDYRGGHIPGALNFPLGSMLMEDTSRAALDRLGRAAQVALAERGIRPDETIVLLDDSDGSASFGLFICELAGMSNVLVIPGGVRAWLNAGEAFDGTPVRREPCRLAWNNIEPKLETVAGIDDLMGMSRRGTRVVDTRSQLEFEGIVGSPCCKSRGHIPGSHHLEWTTLLSATGELHDTERILGQAQQLGLMPHDDIIVYCHSGQRSAVAGVALRAAGFSRIRNSLGSWHEWSHRELPRGPEA